jgi:hypothetical protein
MSVPASMQKLFGYIDSNRETFIENLSEAVAIKSVSGWPEAREARGVCSFVHMKQ